LTGWRIDIKSEASVAEAEFLQFSSFDGSKEEEAEEVGSEGAPQENPPAVDAAEAEGAPRENPPAVDAAEVEDAPKKKRVAVKATKE
jgi:hypothetical protein